MNHKYIVVLIIAIVIGGCSTQKSTVNNVIQEYEADERQKAFDELYEEFHNNYPR